MLRALFRNTRLDRGIRGDAVKELTRRAVEAALIVVNEGTAQWKNWKKIELALTAELSGVQVRFDPYLSYGKLHATIIWDEFEEQSIMDRQRRVHTLLKSMLTDEERYKTGFLLTVTPTEINAMQEAPVAA